MQENWTINYAYRNAVVQDDEQTRILEEIETNADEFFAEFPEIIREPMRRAIAASDWETFANLLVPYITDAELAQRDFPKWESLLLGDEDDAA